MLAICVPITDWDEYSRCALPGIERVRRLAPETRVLARSGLPSYQVAVNTMLDELADEPDLTGAVVMHQDVELLSPQAVLALSERFAGYPKVAIIGAAGGLGRRGISWALDGVNVHHLAVPEPHPPNEVPGGFGLVESVDGLFIALSPWATRTLRFDEALAANFHGYDMDICMQARAHGRQVAVDSIALRHHQMDGYRGDRARMWVQADLAIRRKWDLPRHTAGRAWTLGSTSDR